MKRATESGEALRIAWPPSAALGAAAGCRKPYHHRAATAPGTDAVAGASTPPSLLQLQAGWQKMATLGASGRMDCGRTRGRRGKEGIGEQGNYNSSNEPLIPLTSYHKRAQNAHPHVSFWSCLGIFFPLFSLPSSCLQSWHVDVEKATIPTPHLRNAMLTVTNQHLPHTNA